MSGGAIQGVVEYPPAKVNLFLEVVGRRDDGFHNILTVMSAIELRDTLAVKRSSGTSINMGPHLDVAPESNLVIKAQKALERHVGRELPAEFRLIKRIPAGAGLGGGSSDAAAALRCLNRLYELGLGRSELAAVGAQVGSDVPFFAYCRTALCRGRGEIVAPLPVQRSIPLVIVCSEVHVATGDVYLNLKRTLTGNGKNVNWGWCFGEGSLFGNAHVQRNDLESVAFTVAPELLEVRRRLGKFGCPVMLTGTGAAFVVRSQGKAAAGIRDAALREGWRAWLTRTNAGC